MRELKFRVWNPVDKKFVDNFNWFLIRLDGTVVDGNDCPYDEHYIITQYTGLKDIKGKDIYEGDIVRELINGYDVYGKIHEVIFINGSFIVDESHLGLFNDYVKVVGNIFENKELLK